MDKANDIAITDIARLRLEKLLLQEDISNFLEGREAKSDFPHLFNLVDQDLVRLTPRLSHSFFIYLLFLFL